MGGTRSPAANSKCWRSAARNDQSAASNIGRGDRGTPPLVREEIWRCIQDLKRERLSILLIDKHLDRILEVEYSHYVVEKGRTVWEGATAGFVPTNLSRGDTWK